MFLVEKELVIFFLSVRHLVDLAQDTWLDFGAADKNELLLH